MTDVPPELLSEARQADVVTFGSPSAVKCAHCGVAVAQLPPSCMPSSLSPLNVLVVCLCVACHNDLQGAVSHWHIHEALTG